MGCLGSRQRMASPAASADETATRRSTTPPCSGRSASRRRATRRTRRIMRGRRGGNQSSMGREPIVASCARRVPDHLGEIRVRSDRAAGPAQALGDVPVAARGPRRVARSRRRGTARVARARVLRRGAAPASRSRGEGDDPANLFYDVFATPPRGRSTWHPRRGREPPPRTIHAAPAAGPRPSRRYLSDCKHEIVCVVEGVDNTTSCTVQSLHSYVRRADTSPMNRGDAAAATRICRGRASRRRRGYDVDGPRRRRRGRSAETSAATPRRDRRAPAGTKRRRRDAGTIRRWAISPGTARSRRASPARPMAAVAWTWARYTTSSGQRERRRRRTPKLTN